MHQQGGPKGNPRHIPPREHVFLRQRVRRDAVSEGPTSGVTGQDQEHRLPSEDRRLRRVKPGISRLGVHVSRGGLHSGFKIAKSQS